MVGASSADDAGVYKLNDEVALIQTLDFFTPIADDPYLFGQIAAANALSDVYAMGGQPLTAMNICCFPIEDMDKADLREILRGGLDKVHEAGALLVGGHSVEDPELKYGLSVTGVVHPDRVVTNGGVKAGQALILTKPLGTGIISTALKANLASPEAVEKSIITMSTLNSEAARVMDACLVTGATDVTGFGLLGHALEMAESANLGITIEAERVPILPEAKEMANMGLVPMGTHRNRNFCQKSLVFEGQPDPVLGDLLTDAQTSGGILMGVDQDQVEKAMEMFASAKVEAAVIGHVQNETPSQVKVLFSGTAKPSLF